MEHTKLAIIGSGPAGYTAALYAARADLAPTLFAGQKSGGQLMWTTDIENFPGFPEGITGPDLMINMRKQAERFGTKILDKDVTAIDFSVRPFKLQTADTEMTADAVILSLGAQSIPVGVPGEQEFIGRGVSTCAVCDAAFYRGKRTYVIGGGDSAMEDTLALTKFADSVTVVHRRDQFKASKIMQERVLSNAKVKVIWNSSLKEIRGDEVVTEIVIEHDGTSETLPTDGVFIAIGHKPTSELVAQAVALDDHGYIVTRQSATKNGVTAANAALSEVGLVAFPSMTSVEGIFAAGDCVDIRYKQAITAAGQGCSAALDAERWLESQE
ncbi:MAG: thioredoxin-disulfide reductase [Candidatus Pacebacteria bacterium CG10_big_fil_rev_8_21_14_0_10_42_12]|nr:thioredoxin-disulfide reductase [Candidatus Paceibacterota bacterium]PIR62191.1 MAG: thioredoxin-disulfide reductase [Candidatus Pacebacteria bacterium CG10_big_fil_rev_8_21_14_0_10_42_12]